MVDIPKFILKFLLLKVNKIFAIWDPEVERNGLTTIVVDTPKSFGFLRERKGFTT